MTRRAQAPAGTAHRCGVVALLGRPNSGKSSLLNALLGEKVAIASGRAQTTRGQLLGVKSLPHAQILLRDTPGLNRGRSRFNLALNERALAAAEDADLRLLLFECGSQWDAPEERLAALPGPTLLLRTKRDLARPGPVPNPDRFADVLEVSAERGLGLDALEQRMLAFLPEGPALYPDSYLTDAPLRFLSAELIREVVFDLYRDEIPYAVAVEVERWQERECDLVLDANLLVERPTQKAIVVGKGGQMLKRVGSAARHKIAELVGVPVHLRLWVKTDKNWSKRPGRARELGYL